MASPQAREGAKVAETAALKQFRDALQPFFGAEGHPYFSIPKLVPNPHVHDSRRGPVGTTSTYRGVTKHESHFFHLELVERRVCSKTRRYESHIWKKGKQLYAGAFEKEDDAAKAHDILALSIKGSDAVTNFLPECYAQLRQYVEHLTQEEVICCLRRCARRGNDAPKRPLARRCSDPLPSSVGPSQRKQKSLAPPVPMPLPYPVCPSPKIIPNLLPMLPTQDLHQTFSHESMWTGWECENDMSVRMGMAADPYSVTAHSLGVSIVEGRVVEPTTIFEAPRELHRSQSINLPNVLMMDCKMEDVEKENDCSDYFSDQEIQEVIRTISLRDEYEMQLYALEDKLMELDEDYDHLFL